MQEKSRKNQKQVNINPDISLQEKGTDKDWCLFYCYIAYNMQYNQRMQIKKVACFKWKIEH